MQLFSLQLPGICSISREGKTLSPDHLKTEEENGKDLESLVAQLLSAAV